MCLIANRFRPFLVTLRKRKVYKMLMLYGKRGKLVTPFMLKEVTGKNIEASGSIEIPIRYGMRKCIDGGMIHSFTNMESALICAELMKPDCKSSNYLVVYEAIIPPFTLYIKGKWHEAASRRLELVKEVYKI